MAASNAHRLYSSPSTVSTESAVRALQENKWQASLPEPPSLVHFNLRRNVRLALITAPRFRADGLGFPMFSVEFFSLKW
jgi:hypothetical protein